MSSAWYYVLIRSSPTKKTSGWENTLGQLKLRTYKLLSGFSTSLLLAHHDLWPLGSSWFSQHYRRLTHADSHPQVTCDGIRWPILPLLLLSSHLSAHLSPHPLQTGKPYYPCPYLNPKWSMLKSRIKCINWEINTFSLWMVFIFFYTICI